MLRQRFLTFSAVTVAMFLMTLSSMLWPSTLEQARSSAVSGYSTLNPWGTPIAVADELNDRRKAQQKRSAEAKAELEKAHAAMEGVDSKLAAVYIKKKELESKIPAAVAEVEEANVDLASSQRKEEIVSSRLASAQQQLQQLESSIRSNGSKLSDTKKTVGELVRRTYRGEAGNSPMTLVLTNTSVTDISDLAAAADTAAALQERMSFQLESALADSKARQNRQAALTESVMQLRQQASEAVDQYQSALAKKKQKADSLLSLHEQNEKLQKELNEKRTELAQSEREAQADISKANAKMAEIDREIAKREAAARDKATAQHKVYVPDTMPSTGSGVWGRPISRPIIVVSPWGYRVHPIFGTANFHRGADIRSAAGEKQYATHDGVVKDTHRGPFCGNIVAIDHGSFGGHRWMTRHCHLSAILVHVGQHVRKGDVIGLTGATGRVTGPHVHYEIWRDGQSVNPVPYLGL